MIKVIICSGCSFTHNWWPANLKDIYLDDMEVVNTARLSAGNDFILRSSLHAITEYLNKGYKPNEILAINMWSGIDRKGTFISKDETPMYEKLQNKEYGITNPINMWDNVKSYDDSVEKGWLTGSLGCQFGNHNITEFNRSLHKLTHTHEGFAHDSYMYFLSFQTFCESLGIEYLNTTYAGILHYPTNMYLRDELKYKYKTLTTVAYPELSMYADHLKSEKWALWHTYFGLYEFMCDFSDGSTDLSTGDNFHPGYEISRQYCDEVILPNLKGIL